MKTREWGPRGIVLARRSGQLRSRVAINFSLAGVILLIVLLSVAYTFLHYQLQQEFSDELIRTATVAAAQVDPELHAQIRTPDDQIGAAYTELADRLRTLRDSMGNFEIRAIYTMRIDDQGKLVFVVDTALATEANFSSPGKLYQSPGPVLMENFRTLHEAMVEPEPYSDEYGTWFSAYAPITRPDGQLEGIVGVDISSETVMERQRELIWGVVIYFLGAIAVIGTLGWWLGRRLASPVNTLIAGAEQILGGDLDYEIALHSDDEFEQLGRLFNALALRLNQMLGQVERQVTERTAVLEQRAAYLTGVSEVGRLLTGTLSLDLLLMQAPELIARQFRLHHCAVFLIDDSWEWVGLRSASSATGRQWLIQGVRVRLGEGVIGYVAQTGQLRVLDEDELKANAADSLMLSGTQSQVVLPLDAEGRILGVLDLQSVEPEVFSSEAIASLRILAEQFSVALENARRFQEQQRALLSLQESTRIGVRHGWQEWAGTIQGYRYTPAGVGPIQAGEVAEGTPAATGAEPGSENQVALPIRVLGMSLGTLELRRDAQRPWTAREIEFLTKATNEIAQVMENARLFESARQRAAREQLTGEITAQIRASADVTTILQTSLRTLGRTLRAAQGMIWLETDPGAAAGGKDGDYDGEIRIGLIASLSGKYVEASGKPTIEGAQLAVRAVNEAGGLEIQGRRYCVVLMAEDDRAEPELALAAVHKLINQEQVVAVIGPQFSRNAVPVAEVVEQSRMVMLSPMSTNPMTTQGKHYVFRVGFVDDFQGQAMARFARTELKAQRAAILYDNASDYNRGIALIFKRAFEGSGGEVVALEPYITGEGNFIPALTRIQESHPEVLFLPNYPDDLAVQLEQAHQLGIQATVLGSDAWDGVQPSTPALMEGAYYTHHWHRTSTGRVSQEFVRNYRRIYDREPRITAALTYDALMLLFEAIERQGNCSPEAICEGLQQLTYEGVSGTIRYQHGGDPSKAVVIMRFKDGQAEFYQLLEPM